MQELRERCGACVVTYVLEVVSHAEVKKEYFHELLFRSYRIWLEEFFQILLGEVLLLLFLLLLGPPLLISLLNLKGPLCLFKHHLGDGFHFLFAWLYQAKIFWLCNARNCWVLLFLLDDS
jgi:hypothetical protein